MTESRHLLDTTDGEVRITGLERPYEFTSPFAGADFAVMLFVVDDDVSPDERSALSDALVAAGCRYAVCAGHECSAWDDSIDWAYLKTDPDFDPPQERMVLTTWHDDDTLGEVAEFFVWSTFIDGEAPTKFLALVLGGGAAHLEQVAAALRAAATDDEPT